MMKNYFIRIMSQVCSENHRIKVYKYLMSWCTEFMLYVAKLNFLEALGSRWNTKISEDYN